MIRKTMLLSILVVFFGMQLVAQTAPATKSADNVNVVNTPSVNVVNTPTVQLAGTSTVQVSGTTNVHVQNDSTTPVPVQDVSQPKRTPFQVNQNFGPAPFSNDNLVSVTVTVPTGKRLVIEHVSARALLPFSSQSPFVMFSISTTVAGVSVEHFLDLPQVFSFLCQSCGNVSQANNQVSQAIKLYSDAGPTVQLTALANITVGLQIDVNFAISGYLEDAP